MQLYPSDMASASTAAGFKRNLGDTFCSEETDKVCRRAVISAKLCSNAATRFAFKGRTGREGLEGKRADRYESSAQKPLRLAAHRANDSLRLLAGRVGGRDGGDLKVDSCWMTSEMKEDDWMMQVNVVPGLGGKPNDPPGAGLTHR